MKLKDNTILKEINNEFIIIPLSDDNMDYDIILKTNKVGAAIYNLLENEIDYDNLIKSLYDRFDVDINVLKEDVDQFINSLREKGLLDD